MKNFLQFRDRYESLSMEYEWIISDGFFYMPLTPLIEIFYYFNALHEGITE